MKLFICGHARHGKDTMAEELREEWGMTFHDSSYFMAERLVIEMMEREYGISYPSAHDCWLDRHNHRPKWYKIITEYNQNNPTRLTREIFEDADIYVGCRNRSEFLAAKHLADLSIWVDASQRLGAEPNSSMSIERADCDIVIENNESLIIFKEKIHRLMSLLRGEEK